MSHPYASEAYVRGLPHLGEAFHVPEWQGCLLSRPIPACGLRDAAGPYPILPLEPGVDLAGGLARLASAGHVAAVLVAEDALRPPVGELEQAFDFVRPFKSHYVFDRREGALVYDKHHRYEVRRASTRVDAGEFPLAERLPAWTQLYAQLTARHGLGGLHDFPAGHHDMLARLPGLRAFGAFMGDELVSAHLFVTHGEHAMSHLAATSAEGYRNGAAYAVNDFAVSALTDCRLINFGGGAGMEDDPSDGLARFKKGFSNRIAPSYLCGAVLDAEAYARLSAGREESGFFPAYRGRR